MEEAMISAMLFAIADLLAFCVYLMTVIRGS